MIKEIFDWSEAWAPLIPLGILIFYKNQPGYFKPVIIYLFLAVSLNLLADIIWKQRATSIFPTDNNNPIYNIHSIARLFCFSLFFIHLKQNFLKTVKVILPILFVIFLFINFNYFENFTERKISANLHAIEAGILLFYCLQYFLYLQKEDESSYLKMPHFWVVIGLSIFVAASIPIYLFYDKAITADLPFTITIWQVQKIVFLILCILIGKAFYESNR